MTRIRITRRCGPARRCMAPDGGLFLSRHADLLGVYKDRAVFSSDKKIEFRPKFGDSLLTSITQPRWSSTTRRSTRVRRAIAGALSPRAIAGMDSVVQALVDGLITDLDARHRAGAGIDAVADFAQNIPIEVIGNLLAIPRHERGPLRDWSLAILGALEPEISAAQFELGETAVHEFLAYLDALVARQRAEGLDEATDIMARLIRETGAAGEDANLLPHELLQNCIFILNAGHETTTNLICSGIWLLSQRPRIVAELNAEPGLWPAAVEEIPAHGKPEPAWQRARPVRLRDGWQDVAGRTLITLGMGAANRDPEVFDDPDSFQPRPRRQPASGLCRRRACLCRQHHCPDRGAYRACGLFGRWPDLRLAMACAARRGSASAASNRCRSFSGHRPDTAMTPVHDGTGLCRRER